MKRILVLMAVCAVTLGACGKRGELERPPPLWGQPETPTPASK